jgi:hypothetical protein
LSEESIDLLLQDLPTADATPIPQMDMGDFTSSAVLLTLLDGIVITTLGPRYAMTKDERKLIGEPLERILARFPAAQMAQYAQYVDPLLLLMGLVSWGSRLSRLRREAAATVAPSPVTPVPQAADKAPEKKTKPEPRAEELMSAPAGFHDLMGAL